MSKIYKFELDISGETIIPNVIKILHVGYSWPDNIPCLWAEVDPSGEDVLAHDIRVRMVGTGESPPEEMVFFGTIQSKDLYPVLHIYWKLHNGETK